MNTQTLKKIYLAIIAVGFVSMLTAGTIVNTNTASFDALNLEATINSELEEDAFEIEEWMVSDSYWMTNEQKTELVETEPQAEEKPILIEDWMTDNELWNM